MRIPTTPWSAPSVAVYAADGLPVCTLGTLEMVDAYRQRGETGGRMIADTAQLIVAAPALLEALVNLQREVRAAGLLNVKKHFNLCCADAAANTAISLTVRPLSPSEQGETLTVPR